MKTTITSNHFTDPKDGSPAGGSTYGNGFAIAWQNGPLGRDAGRKPPNGAFVEDIIAAAIDRIAFYQDHGRFWCQENADALNHLEIAAQLLNKRTERREKSGTEGTHQGN